MGAPFLEAPDDSQEFLVVNLIISLCGGVFLLIDHDRTENSVIVVLRKYAGGDIGFPYNGFLWVKVHQYGAEVSVRVKSWKVALASSSIRI